MAVKETDTDIVVPGLPHVIWESDYSLSDDGGYWVCLVRRGLPPYSDKRVITMLCDREAGLEFGEVGQMTKLERELLLSPEQQRYLYASVQPHMLRPEIEKAMVEKFVAIEEIYHQAVADNPTTD